MLFKEIWKYTVPVRDDALYIEMPFGSRILSVHCQGGDDLFSPKIWVAVNPGWAMDNRVLIWLPTGGIYCAHKPDENLEFIGTVLLLKDQLVTHLFEVVEKEQP